MKQSEEVKLSDYVDFGICKINKDEFIDPHKKLIYPENGYLTEDMVQITYPKRYLTLDVGWYGGRNGVFRIMLIYRYNWENPIINKKTKSAKKVRKIVRNIINLINE
jgi:hypothetical protein